MFSAPGEKRKMLNHRGSARIRCGWTYAGLRNTDADMNAFRISFIGLAFLLSAALIALAQTPAAKSTTSSKSIAVLHPTGGIKVSCTVTFTRVADGVEVQADIAFLRPGK